MPQSPENPDVAPGRSEVLTAATDLFSEKGYDGVSMNAIAKRAGTSKANVFHHYRSKDALYLEVMRAACAEFASVTAALDEDGHAFGERLREFLRRDFEMLRANPDRSRLIMREILESGPSRGQALASEVFGEHFAEVVALFEHAQQQGVFTRDVPPALAAVVTIASNTILFQSQHLLRHLPGVDFVDDADRYAGLVCRVLLEGLQHDGSDPDPGGNVE